jgi:hypothetical protein
MMQAFSVEQSIIEGDNQVKELFAFIQEHAAEFEAYEMEKDIFARLMKIGLSAMKCYFGQKGTGDVGGALVSKNKTVLIRQNQLCGRDYFSVFGKLKVPRTCYRFEGESGVMPLDAQANLPKRCYSYLLQEWMDFFSIRETFGESHLSLEKLLGLNVGASRFEVVNRESSKDYDDFYAGKQAPPADSEGKIQVLSLDGKGVPVIKREAAKLKARLGKGEKRQKKKEALVGVSYTIDPNVRTPEAVAENLIYPEKARQKRLEKDASSPVRAQNIRRLASLERSKKEVAEEIIRDARARNPDYKRPWVVVMDGALHLWTLIGTLLKGIDYIGILDIIHVVEYLWDAVNALYDEKDPGKEKWVYERLLSILQGRVGRVIGGLKQSLKKRKLKKKERETIEKVILYFENHRKWMRYDEYLQAGYPIGSGVVESTCGHTVKDRMEGSGRRWSIEGAESTLLLRSVYTSGDWDEYWQSHMALQRERLYKNSLNSWNCTDDYFSIELEEVAQFQ